MAQVDLSNLSLRVNHPLRGASRPADCPTRTRSLRLDLYPIRARWSDHQHPDSTLRWGVIGAGGEVGRTVEWNQIVIDLNVGAYTTKNIYYKAQADGLANASKPDELLAIKPSLMGFGYAF